MSLFRLFLAAVVASVASTAQSLPDFEKRVTEFTLPNGLHFVLLERHDAPVVSFHTYVNVGSLAFLPNMHEPSWGPPGKALSAIAEGAGALLALGGLIWSIRRARRI